MDEWELEFGGRHPERVSDLMREVVDGRLSQRMTANQRATTAWYRANGDRERAHTVGVFLKKARVAGAPPIMGVYVDSHAMATDFGVNKDLYLARLANIGCEVSGIEFIPSRHKRSSQQTPGTTPETTPDQLPELTPLERAEVAALVEDLPDELRPSVSKAIELSKRREKQKSSKNA